MAANPIVPQPINTTQDPALNRAYDKATRYLGDNTQIVEAGDNVLVINTPKDVYVEVYDTNIVQNFINNNTDNPAGNTGDIQFNDAGNLAADSELTYNPATNVLSAGSVATDNLLYANGQPWNFSVAGAAGSNNQVQYNIGGVLAASSTFQFNPSTNALSVGGQISSLGVTVSGNGIFTGNGSGLTNLAGANVTGQVANAAFATIAATANSVAGANVVGQVGSANFATFSSQADSALTVAGANVTGQVNFAATANSVAGANVSGVVANAAYATLSGTADIALSVSGSNVVGNVASAVNAFTSNVAAVANSVAVANVVGIGNIATTNYNGNGGQVLAGNGVWVTPASAGVSSLNGETGAVTIAAGTGINVVTAGGIITVTNTGGSGNVTAAGANTQVQFNNGGLFGASANLTFDVTSNTLSATALSATSANITDITVANAVSAAVLSANTLNANNITIANLITTNDIDANIAHMDAAEIGNIDIGNLVEPQHDAIFHNALDTALNIRSGNTSNGIYIYSYGSDGEGTGAGEVNIANSGVEIYGSWDANTVLAKRWRFTNSGLIEFPDATTQNTAWTGTVAGSNVIGAVANATFATSAGSATTAGNAQTLNGFVQDVTAAANSIVLRDNFGRISVNEVLGTISGSNVNGAVAFATTANSVAVANVVGIGNISTINLTGSNANVLYGNGVFAAIPGTVQGSQVLVVDNTGSDSTGDGSLSKPFATLQAAHDYAVANIASFLWVTIQVNPGTYPGATNISRNFVLISGQVDSWVTGLVTISAAAKNVRFSGLRLAGGFNATAATTQCNYSFYNIIAAGGNWDVTLTDSIGLESYFQVYNSVFLPGSFSLDITAGESYFYGSSLNGMFVQRAKVYATGSSFWEGTYTFNAGAVATISGCSSAAAIINVDAISTIVADAAFLGPVTLNTGLGATVTKTTKYSDITGTPTLGNIVTTNFNGNGSTVLAGNGAWVAQTTPTTPAGANTQIQFNNAGLFGASVNLSFDSATNTLSTTNVAATRMQFADATVQNTAWTGTVAGANVIGAVANATFATSAGSATDAVTVTASSQPNITSVGVLSSLQVGNSTSNISLDSTGISMPIATTLYTGRLVVQGANATLGPVGNVVITGGTTGQVLTTDGSGNLSFTTPAAPLLSVANVSSTPYTVTANTQFLYVTNATATTVDLPETVVVGSEIIVKDGVGTNRVGNAITVSVANGTIDGNATYTINAAWNSVTFVGVGPNTYAAI